MGCHSASQASRQSSQARLLRELASIESSFLDLSRRPLPKEVYVFPAGSQAVRAFSELRDAGVLVRAFLDNSATLRPGWEIEGIDVIAPDDSRVETDVPVVLATHDCHLASMVVQLSALGFPRPYIGVSGKRDEGGDQRKDYATFLVEDYAGEVLEVLDALEDEASRTTYLSVVKCRVEADRRFLKLSSYPEYLHPRVLPRAGDTALDLGAFDGTVSAMLSRRIGEGGTLHCFEPSRENLPVLRKNIEEWGIGESVAVVDKGVWSFTGVVNFTMESVWGGSNHRIDPEGEASVEVVDIDSYVEELGVERVDLIKADIEGAELEALKGAASTIRRWKPRLLFCIYHGNEHLWSVPVFVKQLVPEYRLYVGHHSGGTSETILYAVSD